MTTTKTPRATFTATHRNTCEVTYTTDQGDLVTRMFWAPVYGGSVYEETTLRHGTSGYQVCGELAHMGSTLTWNREREALIDMIRREYRAMRRADAKRWA